MQQIYRILLPGLFATALIVFVILFFISAPYGRFDKKRKGPHLPSRWGWFLMEFPAFAVILLFYILSESYRNPVTTVFILLWELHYFQRDLVYPFLQPPKASPIPVAIIASAFFFNIWNGFINGYGIFMNPLTPAYSIEWFLDPRFMIGSTLFLSGWIINIHSDHIIRQIKKESGEGYKIPYKGLHKWIASPNYFGEVIEWSGWAVLTWSWAGLAFAVFTFANLAPRAFSHRKWYKQEFGSEYPEKRKALIPFLF